MNPSIGRLDALAGFRPATPDLIAARCLDCRTDTKFVLSVHAAAALIESLRDHYAAIVSAGRSFSAYRTVYHDTPALDFFRAQCRGRRRRYKVRIRHYLDRGLSTFEVKARVNDLRTEKFAFEHDFGADELDREDHALVRSRTGVEGIVEPRAWTWFRRLTLVGLRTNERVTVDVDLVVGSDAGVWTFGSMAVVEVKQWPFRRRTPAMAALRALGSRPQWVSKSFTAVALSHPDIQRGVRARDFVGFVRHAA